MHDPYKALGVPRTADAETIKRAYRKLAKQLHPDVNPGNATVERQFKDVSAAYDLLSDPDKRQRFDRGEIDSQGNERPGARRPHAGPRAGARGADPDDIWEMFRQARAGAGAAGAGASAGAGAGSRRRGADVTYSVTVDFIAAAVGTKRRITLPDGRAIDVAIPPGTGDGTQLRLKGQGQPGLGGGHAGDAFVDISVQPHQFFVRKGDDIHVDVPVTLQEAVLGASITIPTIDGKVSVKVPRGANSGTTLRLKGRGIANPKAGTRGDQYVSLTVVLPERQDTDLVAFVERWGPANLYDVRRKAGLED
ncbi:MAG: J domain-containing protein [Alphaproteobacteria bacterium]|nr:MAG: J domain-containing protein [Alphaproteobacteria bacterium]